MFSLDFSPIEYMMAQFADLKEIDAVRKIIGRYGITGKAQVINTQSYTTRWFKPPVDIKTKVPFWPGLPGLIQAKTELLL